jgi:hypothetical protein
MVPSKALPNRWLTDAPGTKAIDADDGDENQGGDRKRPRLRREQKVHGRQAVR